MIADLDTSSTRPYLIRALYEWCTDNALTPYVVVVVNEQVQVPREFVKDGEIVLNISFDATSALQLGNEFIEFKARFGGVARDIMVPISQVAAIFAKENGQGMAFPRPSAQGDKKTLTAAPVAGLNLKSENTQVVLPEGKPVQLSRVTSERSPDEAGDEPDPSRPTSAGVRPFLKRVK
jgi:stringent starvation protein B